MQVKRIALVLKRVLAVKKDEQFLIVSDEHKSRLARLFYNAARRITTQAHFLIFPSIRESGAEPPSIVASAIQSSSVFLILTKFSLTHTHAVKTATKLGARGVSMPGFTRQMFRALFVDYRKLAAIGKRVAKELRKAKEVEVSSRSGTRLKFEISGREVHVDDGDLREKGRLGNLPAGEVFVAPIEESANGILVIDSMKSAGVTYARKGTKIEIRNGKAVGISNKQCRLARVFRRVKNAGFLCEFGIGINPKAKVIGNILQDEKALGTCHVAFGTNITFGGKIKSSVHLDAIIFKPTIKIDGKILMKDGKFVFKHHNLIKH